MAMMNYGYFLLFFGFLELLNWFFCCSSFPLTYEDSFTQANGNDQKFDFKSKWVFLYSSMNFATTKNARLLLFFYIFVLPDLLIRLVSFTIVRVNEIFHWLEYFVNSLHDKEAFLFIVERCDINGNCIHLVFIASETKSIQERKIKQKEKPIEQCRTSAYYHSIRIHKCLCSNLYCNCLKFIWNHTSNWFFFILLLCYLSLSPLSRSSSLDDGHEINE